MLYLTPKIVDTRHQPDEDDLKLDSLVQLLRNGVGLLHRRHHIDQVLLQQPRIYLCFSAEVEKSKKNVQIDQPEAGPCRCYFHSGRQPLEIIF